ncbi:TIGR04255 family protein [Alkalicaulis satelles]|uniref:TIGR04255 family protein n=1 Tax=Alkalicaulis satelles TaxID=2609175 RepID=A0A5M6ZJ69_9PROT|nr:TIGR04255 family protein [Alkalicaulis satelles]KAA5803737.1 TIGR04255 family protein [Alkalicaulis satelles]
MHARPEHLPEFSHPPLVELALGVQFAPLPNYSSLFLGDVFRIFQDEFPGFQEHPPLNPQFETFGGGGTDAEFSIGLGPSVAFNRAWFLSTDNSHLIQFQPDRFILNWRRQADGNVYPRFDNIAMQFKNLFSKFDEYCKARFELPININQVEVTYFNVIVVSDYSSIGEWLTVANLSRFEIEGFSANFSTVVGSDGGEPIGRLHHEIGSVVGRNLASKAFRYNLTCRGAPQANDIDSALDFSAWAREKIVTRFTETTSGDAHLRWGKK